MLGANRSGEIDNVGRELDHHEIIGGEKVIVAGENFCLPLPRRFRAAFDPRQ